MINLCDKVTKMENIPACELLNPATPVKVIGAAVSGVLKRGQVTYLMSDGSHCTYNVGMEEAVEAIKIINS